MEPKPTNDGIPLQMMPHAAMGCTFYRMNKDHAFGAPPTILTYKELWSLLCANFRHPEKTLYKILAGKEVKSRYGTYWAERKT